MSPRYKGGYLKLKKSTEEVDALVKHVIENVNSNIKQRVFTQTRKGNGLRKKQLSQALDRKVGYHQVLKVVHKTYSSGLIPLLPFYRR